ncbi:unnamed protein product [Closterium sp. NIES-64]|nr:unnamed protein product [Closterium sp. NIES-64]
MGFPTPFALLPPSLCPASPLPLPCFPPPSALLPPILLPASPHPAPCFPPSPSLLPPIPFPASPHPLPFSTRCIATRTRMQKFFDDWIPWH